MSTPNTPARVVAGRLRGASFLDDRRVRLILELLHGGGEEARVVGGAIRNALLGEGVEEVDFATTAPPQIVLARAAAAGLKSAPTGLEHGTVTLLIEGSPFEVTTLRDDVETDGRHAKVRFSRSFEGDARRRDFTINALSVDGDGVLYDYADGLADLARGTIRFIGDPRLRIREDYLRSLRFFRFFAAFGLGAPDAAALAAVIAERDGLERLSRERVRAELLKLTLGARAAEAASIMSECGLFLILLGGVVYPSRLARCIAIEAALASPADALLRLGALSCGVADDAERLRERLRLSNSEYDRLRAASAGVAALHGRETPPDFRDLRAMLFLRGRRACMDALALAHAESRADVDANDWISASRFLRDTPEPRAPFDGADLMARGLPAGRLLGSTLKKLQARWIRAGFPTDALLVARLIDEALAEARES